MALGDDKKNIRKTNALSDRRRVPRGEDGESAGNRDVGHALRSVYARTVSEDIPPDLLDLLGKLS